MQYPLVDIFARHHPVMGKAKRNTDEAARESVDAIRANLLRLREHIGSPTYEVLADKSGVGYGTLQRLYTGSAGPSGKNPPPNLDTLAALAKFFGLDLWQLLVPGLDPANPPRLAGQETADEAPRKVRAVTRAKALAE